jgi:hypothetical protein
MVALTCDLHVFASCVATRLSAVFFPICYSAKTRDVCAHFGALIWHFHSVLSNSDLPAPMTEALRILT